MINTGSQNKGTILLVDDTPTNLDVLFHYLDNFGFEVFVAINGEDALRQAEQTLPDLILLDVMMPGIDGFEVCRRLKEIPTTRHIPVIFMTALSSTTDKLRGFEVGAVDYVTKPLQYKEVLARVTTHLTLQRLQADLQNNIRELELRNHELDAFARTVAHNFKNPLNVILNAAEIIEEFGYLSSSLQQHLQTIIKTAEQMNNNTDALLMLAHIRKTEVDLTPLNMAEIVARSRGQLDHMLAEYQAQLLMPREWPMAQGYAPWVEEVWNNYISNAVKYGGRPPRIEIGATYLPNGFIRFWVTDNGAGLKPEEQEQLFIEFKRLRQVKVEGHGLGLSIVQRIVTKLGGQVGIESRLGQGSTFYFTLPRAELNF
ncbi:MAG TPA: response regulator [Anaerolineae bacterium]|nr:response regulator [Anaerolineae bacterium]HMR64995.1 response regulator [Anaerolineae bacterium]